MQTHSGRAESLKKLETPIQERFSYIPFEICNINNTLNSARKQVMKSQFILLVNIQDHRIISIICLLRIVMLKQKF